MARQPLKYKITKSVVPMFISDYAGSGLYLGKTVTLGRISQLIKAKVLKVCRVHPKMIYAYKVEEK